MKRSYRMVLVAAASALALTSMSAQARFGATTASSSKAQTSSRVAFANAAPSATSTGTRFGAGQSVGVTRPDVMAQVRQQKAETFVPSTQPVYGSGYQQRYAAPQPSYLPHPGYGAPAASNHSWLAPAAIGAAAGFVGGRLTAPDHTVVVSQGGGYGVPGSPGYAPGNAGYSDQNGTLSPAQAQLMAPGVAPVVIHQGSGGWGLLGWLLALIVLAAIGYVLYKFITKGESPVSAMHPLFGDTPHPSDARENLKNSAVMAFKAIQDATNRGDLNAIRARTTAEMFDAIQGSFATSGGQSEFRNIQATVSDYSTSGGVSRGSVNIEADTRDTPTDRWGTMDELWNFQQVNGEWKLEGIQQV